eukprot:TRINITY_DN102198_c0_g1_i1.p1 TRINITY_DN102198_c0_g1~~TRINITY_DN102198_c0_g1_i1.p1  ORF type:complete len:218 (+),score=25.95 TRINITY_DN102198_c0_g1_i1:142-795(+)
MSSQEGSLPPYLRPPAGKTQVSRSHSTPGGFRTTSGLPASALHASQAVKVPAVDRCHEPRRDAITGYRGFIPGVKAESIWGTNTVKVNRMAHGFRPVEYHQPGEHVWNCPPDPPQQVRDRKEVENWHTLQADPHSGWMGNQPLERHTGPGKQGFTGHRSMRHSRTTLQPLEAETLRLGERHSLTRTMTTDRDCHPVDVHRVSIPGYMGFLPGKKLAC